MPRAQREESFVIKCAVVPGGSNNKIENWNLTLPVLFLPANRKSGESPVEELKLIIKLFFSSIVAM